MKYDETLSHHVFRKSMHIDKYLHANSYHNLVQYMKVLNTLATRVGKIFDKEHIKQERQHLFKVSRDLGYKSSEFKKTLIRVDREPISTLWQSSYN